MIDNDLKRHGAEFQRYLERGQFETTGDGILFPKAGAIAQGDYFISSPGYEDSIESNLMPHQGLNYLLMCGLSNTAKEAGVYLALYGNDYTPTNALTAANFSATAGELVSSSEGYTESMRPQWSPSAAAGGVISNLDNKAQFTIATADEVVIRGAALLSSPAKGSTAGVLISASKFTKARTHFADDVVTLGYRITLTGT